MIFGDKNSFAVEIKLDEDYGGEWLFGRFCYWIGNVQIGNFTESTTLRDVLSKMKWILYDAGKRNGSLFCHLPTTKAFTEIDNLIYGDSDTEEKDLTDSIKLVVRFNVSITVDAFRGVKIYLMQCGSKDRLIYKIIDNQEVNEKLLNKGLFDNAINQAYTYLDNLHEIEQAR